MFRLTLTPPFPFPFPFLGETLLPVNMLTVTFGQPFSGHYEHVGGL